MVEWELMKVKVFIGELFLCFWKVNMCCFWWTKGVCEFWEVRNQNRVELAEKQKVNSRFGLTDGR